MALKITPRTFRQSIVLSTKRLKFHHKPRETGGDERAQKVKALAAKAGDLN